MGWMKKIGLAFLVLVILGVVFGGDSNTTNTSSKSQENIDTSSTSTTSGSVNNDLSQYMPTRDDIDTTWKIVRKNENTTTSYTDGFYNGVSYNGNKAEIMGMTGFKEAILTEIERESTSGTTMDGGTIALLRFDSVNNAKAYYTGEVLKTKNEGGYEEKSTSGVNAECFAIKSGNYDAGYFTWMICNKKSIVFTVEITSFSQSKMVDYKSLGETIADKIK